ncbi:MAG: hypothetical protein IV094_26595 [Vitreoscilla sp.]|nr:hypothetical protein [Vitreoscilla sp.]
MSKPVHLKPIELSLPALSIVGRALPAAAPDAQTLGIINARKLNKETRKVQLEVSAQLVRDAGAAQAYVNRTRVLNAGAIAVAQITRQTAITNQQLITDISNLSSDTVRFLVDGSLGRSLQTLKSTHAVELTLQADAAGGRLSPELAAQAQQLLSEAAATAINNDREITQLAVKHTRRLTDMVFKSSRIVGTEDDSADDNH